MVFFFFKQKTAYEVRISAWSSDVCSSDLRRVEPFSATRGTVPLATVATDGTMRVLGDHDARHQRQYRQRRRTRRCSGSQWAWPGDRALPRGARRLQRFAPTGGDRKSVVSGKSVSVRVVLGDRSIIE